MDEVQYVEVDAEDIHTHPELAEMYDDMAELVAGGQSVFHGAVPQVVETNMEDGELVHMQLKGPEMWTATWFPSSFRNRHPYLPLEVPNRFVQLVFDRWELVGVIGWPMPSIQ
ncbi:MAG TPA: hypothetical protein VGR62_20575 [Candidatus Binatia bacterium]|nr:hypothetical protein [Candidatus Binatia bacterium]